MYFLKVVVLLCGFACVSANIECPFNLCDESANYPEDEIFSAVSKNNSFKTMFGEILRPEVELIDKIGDGEETARNVCPTEEKTYWPRIGKNINDEEVKIVNVKGYAQSVTIQACKEDARTSIDCILPASFKTACETQHAIIRLVVYNDKKDLDVQEFSIPTGCICTYMSADY